MRKLKILIIGYYGANNTGDEVLLKSTVELLKSVYNSPEIKAITYNVDDTVKNHGIVGISRNKFMNIIKVLRESDIVIGGGGSMIQNVTSNRSLIYYLTILKIAKIFKKKVMLLGNGIGPIKGNIPLCITVKMLKKLDAVILRDKESFNLLDTNGLENIYLGSDLAFSLEYGNCQKSVIPKRIAINLRKWFYERQFLEEFKKFIVYLSEAGYEVVLIPFQSGNDDVVLRELLYSIDGENIRLLESGECEEVLSEISKSELFIGMRLHGLIFSSIVNTPFIGLSYDPKVSAFSESQEQEYFKSIEEVTFEELISKFELSYSNRETYREKLRENTDKMMKLNEVYEKVLIKVKDKVIK